MIDLHRPESKSISILTGQSGAKPVHRPNFEIIQDDNPTDRRILKSQEKCVFPLGWIGGTIDKDEIRPL